MDCYKIARRIMDRIRKQIEYNTLSHEMYHGVVYYDSSNDYEFFSLKYRGVELYVSYGRMLKVEIDHPRGIVLFNLRLWLLEVDRMTK